MPTTKNIFKLISKSKVHIGLGAVAGAGFNYVMPVLKKILNDGTSMSLDFTPHDFLTLSKLFMEFTLKTTLQVIDLSFLPERLSTEQIILVAATLGFFYGLYSQRAILNSNDNIDVFKEHLSNQERLARINYVEDKVPTHFICPITHCIMTRPVVAEDGETYEYSAIKAWLEIKKISPKLNKPIVNDVLWDNKVVQRQIAEFLKKAEDNYEKVSSEFATKFPVKTLGSLSP